MDGKNNAGNGIGNTFKRKRHIVEAKADDFSRLLRIWIKSQKKEEKKQ